MRSENQLNGTFLQKRNKKNRKSYIRNASNTQIHTYIYHTYHICVYRIEFIDSTSQIYRLKINNL